MDCFKPQYLKISIVSSQREFNVTMLWDGIFYAIKTIYIKYLIRIMECIIKITPKNNLFKVQSVL